MNTSQEVAWYCGANHAGGYSYRLCKMPEGGIGDVTEECFQQTPLEFVGKVDFLFNLSPIFRLESSKT